ncbi:MAG TPA: phosphate ABC transporter substrate-binding protein [Thermoanaerobaculia bacterium]|nr:phosphate ABC transporter substrate-binding protein [Thermoanaerobaculia bacterium]
MLSPLFFAAALFLSVAADAQPGAPVRILVVAHPSANVATLTRAEVSSIFMKRTRSWPDGREIVPVDQRPGSRARETFSRSIHGKSVAYVTRYWQRLVFSGRGIPPREEADDDSVLRFVRATPGAIGYVGGTVAGAEGVTVIEVTP